jgi:FMN phosphatase YigB (HAD superfamily)
MFRKELLSLLFVIALPIMGMEQPQVQPAVSTPSITHLDPSKTIFAFDIDEVVLTGREPGYKKILKENPELAQAIDETAKKYHLSDASPIITKTIEEYPALKEKALAFQKAVISAPQIEGTKLLINKLTKNGYSIVAASNMTNSTYLGLVDNKTLPGQFSRNFFFVATNELNKKADGTFFQKPSPEYYQNLITYINKQFPGRFTHIIFTDDKLENAEGAKKVPGIISIHFKNPAQLEQDLISLGVVFESSAACGK